MKQSEAVFQFWTQAKQEGLEGEALKAFVVAEVFKGLASGEINYGKDRADEAKVRSYANSVTGNYFMKDKRIAGAPYVPATRRGPQVKDPTLKSLSLNLKHLKAHEAEMGIITRVEEAIHARRELLAAEKSLGALPSMDEVLESIRASGVEI